MALYLVGDIHGSVVQFKNLHQHLTKDDVIIQVGDFYASPEVINEWNLHCANYPCDVYFIDGNHEPYSIYCTWQHNKKGLYKVANNLFHVARGTVLEIAGKTVAFLGGAESVDRYYRKEGSSWWKDERITRNDVETLRKNISGKQIDLFVTHAPPASVITGAFPPIRRSSWGLPEDWVDVSANMVEEAFRFVLPAMKQNGKMVCGHMHRSISFGPWRVLEIEEVWRLPDGEPSVFEKLVERAQLDSV